MLYWLQGRANTLWLPSWSADMTAVSAIASTSLTLTIAAIGVSRFAIGVRRHLRIELFDGTVFYRALIAAVQSGASEALTLDAVLGQDVQSADIRQINWMIPARLAADAIEIAHWTDADGLAIVAAEFAGVAAEEPV